MDPRPRSQSLLASLSALALTLVACGGAEVSAGGGETTTAVVSTRPTWERTPIVLLARDSFVVAHLDGAQLRRSPYFAYVDSTLRDALHEGSDTEGRTIGALLAGTDDAWIGAREAPGASSDDPQVVAVLRGPGVEEGMRRVLAEDPPSGVHETKGHAEIWRDGSDDAIVRLDGKTWVLVGEGGLDELLARVDGSAPGDPLAEPRMRATAERVGFSARAPMAFVAHLPAQLRAGAAREGFPLSLLADADYVAGRLDPSSGISVDVTADMTSADAAARADDALRGVVASYASNPMVALMGLSDILRRIDVRASGARVDVRASTTDDETRALIQRFGQLVGSAISVGETSTSDAPLASLSRSSAGR